MPRQITKRAKTIESRKKDLLIDNNIQPPPAIKVPCPPKVTCDDFVRNRPKSKVDIKSPNSFFVYRTAFVKQLLIENHKFKMTQVSKWASIHWRQESSETKMEYKAMAQKIDKEFQERRKKIKGYQIICETFPCPKSEEGKQEESSDKEPIIKQQPIKKDQTPLELINWNHQRQHQPQQKQKHRQQQPQKLQQSQQQSQQQPQRLQQSQQQPQRLQQPQQQPQQLQQPQHQPQQLQQPQHQPQQLQQPQHQPQQLQQPQQQPRQLQQQLQQSQQPQQQLQRLQLPQQLQQSQQLPQQQLLLRQQPTQPQSQNYPEYINFSPRSTSSTYSPNCPASPDSPFIKDEFSLPEYQPINDFYPYIPFGENIPHIDFNDKLIWMSNDDIHSPPNPEYYNAAPIYVELSDNSFNEYHY